MKMESEITTTELAKRLGEQAYAAGVKRAPILDVIFTKLENWADMPMMRAWITGWDTANLAAPVEDPTDGRTIWDSDGTDGPVLICLPPKRKDRDVKTYTIRGASAHIEERGQKAIWQDKITGVIRFCDFDDLPKNQVGYWERSEKELHHQAETARLVEKALGHR
jgi:hypothetical protein